MTEKKFIKAIEVIKVPEDDVIGVDINGLNLAIYNVEGEIFATDNICTHGMEMLNYVMDFLMGTRSSVLFTKVSLIFEVARLVLAL